MANVVPSDVDVVAQCAPGSRLRFIEVSTEVAEKIFLEYLLMLSHVKLIEEEVWSELI